MGCGASRHVGGDLVLEPSDPSAVRLTPTKSFSSFKLMSFKPHWLFEQVRMLYCKLYVGGRLVQYHQMTQLYCLVSGVCMHSEGNTGEVIE